MKINKVMAAFMLSTIVLTSSVNTFAATMNASIFVQGKEVKMDVAPELQKSVTYVPLSFIAKELNAKVNWASPVVTVEKDGLTIKLDTKNNTITANGYERDYYEEESQPYITQGRVMVPLRFLSQVFGSKVDYQKDASGKATIKLTSATPLKIGDVECPVMNSIAYGFMGHKTEQLRDNETIRNVYELINKAKANETTAPAVYDIGIAGGVLDAEEAFTGDADLIFVDAKGNEVAHYEIYHHMTQGMSDFTSYLVHDAKENKWYKIDNESATKMGELIDKTPSITVENNWV